MKPAVSPAVDPITHSNRFWIHSRAIVFVCLSLLAGIALQTSSPAFAQNCFNQNGKTICCDGNGNCVQR
jgi:hypothetical protein